MKLIACPRCGEKYELRLGPDESLRLGVVICDKSTNKAFARGDSGFIWCGAAVVYAIQRQRVSNGSFWLAGARSCSIEEALAAGLSDTSPRVAPRKVVK